MRRLLALLALTFACLPGSGQSAEADLFTKLVHKPLYLRGLWASDKLHFDASGQLLSNAAAGSPSFSGIDIGTVSLKSNRLILTGNRVGLSFAPVDPTHPGLLEPQRHALADRIRIEIDAPTTGDYGPALTAIVTPNLGDLATSAPEAWKRVLDPAAPPEPRSPATGRNRTPPRVLQSANPEFSEVARRLKVSGVSRIHLIVEADGSISHLRIDHPLGLGLDEQALLAVQQYIFAPATRDGQPAAVPLSMDVNFQVF
jgi:TonB family protein